MKNKYKNNHAFFFLFFWPLLIVAFFVFKNPCLASHENLITTEIMYDPQGNNENNSEWIEFYNPTEHDIALKKSDFKFNEKENPIFSESSHKFLGCHSIPDDIIIKSHEFIVIAENKDNFIKQEIYKDIPIDKIYDSSFDLSSNNGFINLSNDGCKTFFLRISYNSSWGGNDNGKTLEMIDIDKEYSRENWQESCIPGGTPGQKNSQEEDCAEKEIEDPNENDATKDVPMEQGKSAYAGKIRINEIYPSPITKNGEKEFIELLNLSNEKIDISDWYVLDEKNNKKILASEKTEVEKYFHKYDSFSLNSTGDTVFLYDKDKKLVDKISYTKAKTGCRYAFLESGWRWTSQGTAGNENRFDEKPSAKIERDKKIYAGIYANFSAKISDAVKKYSWDFGDKHKSYLEDARHKYAKAKNYSALFKVSSLCEEKIYDFKVKVEKYSAPKIRVVRLSPNPKGLDSKNEWIEIQNKSKKKINLKGWSVATGTKNLVNHPIREKFEIKPGKAQRLSRDICAFVLGNAVSNLELRDPSGKTIQKISYDRKNNSVKEEEIFEKTETGWNWVETQSNTEKETRNNTEENTQNDTENETQKNTEAGTIQKDTENSLNISPEEARAALGRYSDSPDWKTKGENRIVLLSAGTKISLPQNIIETQGRVLGVSDIRKNTPGPKNNSGFLEKFWMKINSGLNWVLNKI